MAILHGWPVAWSLKVMAYRLHRRSALFLATIQGMYSLTAIDRPAVAKTAMIELSACV
jgi:hypothetical protein